MRKTLSGVSAAIFDLDGTLFDSVKMWHDIDDVFLARRGCIPTIEYKKAIVALGFTATAYYTIDYYKLNDTPEQLMGEWAEMARDSYAHTVKLLPGAREYLEECVANDIRLAAVTSLCAEYAVSCLKNNGIFEMFERVFTADDTGLAKTSPDIYLHAAGALGVEPRACVVFDDAVAAIAAAKKAGMTTVAITGLVFGRDEFDGAAYVVDTLSEAPKLIRNK